MKKITTCRCCNGTGKWEAEYCDKCGEEGRCGDFEGKRYCQPCWVEELSDEDINNL